MKVPDTNVLLEAVNRDSSRHERARDWLIDGLSGPDPIGFTWLALLGFIRIATKRSVFPNPLDSESALGLVDDWLAVPPATVLHPGDRHASILRELIVAAGTAGDLTSDAHLAAIAIERGGTLATFDTDFYRFEGLRLEYLG